MPPPTLVENRAANRILTAQRLLDEIDACIEGIDPEGMAMLDSIVDQIVTLNLRLVP